MSSEMLEAQGTTLEIDTGSGGAVEITAITLANPTILTAAAHGLPNGDVVTISGFVGADAGSINGNTYVVMYVTTDTVAIDLDSTGLDISIDLLVSTPAMTPQAYTKIGNITDWDISGDSHNLIDFTTLGSLRAEEKPGIPRGSATTFSLNWTAGDMGLLAAEAARDEKALKTFKVTYSDAAVHTFPGYVTGINDAGGGDDKVSGSVTIHRVGALKLT
ncbi:MAG: phage tail tube protein [Spirochaetales bacterium]|jgi:hypothetical protein|nr:phage tail tube protein [Spirochaetales bacterium]